MRVCDIEGCAAKHYAKGWCYRHYRTAKHYGDPAHPIRVQRKRAADGICIAPTCDREAPRGRVECIMHLRRMQVHGSYDLPPKVKKQRIPTGTKRTDKYGYVFVFRPDRTDTHRNGFMSEHRMVMSDHLGRPLREDEAVHHRNGIRNDNRIENLELWTVRKAAERSAGG